MYTATRGLRNNNPGNLRRTADQWQGLAPSQTDPDFFQFVSPEYGIRALARVLINYQNNAGLNTLRQIAQRFAPPSENDTGAYAQHLAQVVGVTPDTPINVRDVLPALVPGIIVHENGLNPYSAQTILRGIAMA